MADILNRYTVKAKSCEEEEETGLIYFANVLQNKIYIFENALQV